MYQFISTILLSLLTTGLLAAHDVVEPVVKDALIPVSLCEKELGGEIGHRVHDCIYQNFMAIDLDRDWLNHFRNRRERGNEHYVYYGIGKVLDAGSLFARYTNDPKVLERTNYIADTLVKSRDPDGYVGFWKVEPGNLQEYINWTLHEHEYINLAFVRNYRCFGDLQSLENAKIMADYIMKTFPTEENGFYEANKICTAGLPEGFLELYRVTGEKKYLDFAANVKHGNSYAEIRCESLDSWKQTFTERPAHVYVMLARIYAQTELYRLTGERKLLEMSDFMQNELFRKGKGALLATGSCSEGEHFTYNQNGAGMIGESCVTAYLLRWLDSVLRLSGDMRYGDVMERTIYNALFAAQSPDGRKIRYFTPFSGERPYDSRDYFCCCGNFRRAMAELPQKVYYQTPDGGVAVLLYTPSEKTFQINGQNVTLKQETRYPSDGKVQITLQMEKPTEFAIRFRTPGWCEKMTVQLPGEPVEEILPASQEKGFREYRRTWKNGDTIQLSMPMEWRFLRGRETQKDRVALMRGPVVFCVGVAENAELFQKFPNVRDWILDPASLGNVESYTAIRPDGQKVTAQVKPSSDSDAVAMDVILTEFPDPSGREIYLRVGDPENTAPIRLTDDELLIR
ncbi:MAG: glycoside hydrolase family 127 protein [Planctomycetia bacterium]|nr:glycoside hydrolase family 127 protein [Planctomycetia bacterium]